MYVAVLKSGDVRCLASCRHTSYVLDGIGRLVLQVSESGVQADNFLFNAHHCSLAMLQVCAIADHNKYV